MRSSKLTLRRETLRSLTTRDLTAVGGASTQVWIPTQGSLPVQLTNEPGLVVGFPTQPAPPESWVQIPGAPPRRGSTK